jgi:hypothetical protein
LIDFVQSSTKSSLLSVINLSRSFKLLHSLFKSTVIQGTKRDFILSVKDELDFIISSNTKANSPAYTSISSSFSLYPNGLIPNAPSPNSSELKYTTSL